MQQAGYLCHGCGVYFRPGGYANHLKQSRDPRCMSVRDSVFQPTFSDTSSHHLERILTPERSATPPPPIPEHLYTSEAADLDIEMSDIGSQSQDFPPINNDMNPPSPDQVVSANGHSADGLGCLNELMETIPQRPLSPIIIDSDMDSDLSDDDEGAVRQLDQEPVTPPQAGR